MSKQRSIDYIVDEEGRKKSVVMSYKAYLELLEDLADLGSIAERRDEPRRDLESVIADLKSEGRL